jgi:protein-disulfide isomerase
MKHKLEVLANIATVVVAVVMIGALTGYFRPASPRAPNIEPVPVAEWEKYFAGGHRRGSATAPVTILEFGDYQCSFCARAAAKLDSIIDANPEAVQLIYRHWPLDGHQLAVPAARAAECASRQNKFWEMHRLLYQRQDSLGLIPFEEFARRSGVADDKAFARCLHDPRPQPAITSGAADAEAVGATGTPAILINGKRYPNGFSTTAVAEAIAKSRSTGR